MRVWVDLTNSPHVIIFRPLIARLNARGHEVTVTARDFAQTLGLLERYARTVDAPVEERTTVLGVEPGGRGYRVTTDRGGFEARSVVIATGHCDVPDVPAVATSLPGDVVQLVPNRYRRAAHAEKNPASRASDAQP